MIHHVNILLLSSGVIQGLLLSFWFFRNHKRKLSNIYFSIFLVIIGLQLVFKVVAKSWLMEYMKMPYFFFYSFPYLAGPLLYLYIKSQKSNQFHGKDLLHFLPFVTSAALAVVTLTFGINVFGLNAYALGIGQTISLGIYAYLSLRIASTHLRQLILFATLAEWIIMLAIEWMTIAPELPYAKLLFLVLTGLIYWISYKIISATNLFLQSEAIAVSMSADKLVKYARSSLKEVDSIKIEIELKQLIQREKLFLDPSLTIDAISARLNVSRHHVSQVINERMHKTYSGYINDLRLEEAHRRLTNPSNFHFTLSAIALDSGFSSVSIFNSSFKKRFGTTPSRFRDQFLRQVQA